MGCLLALKFSKKEMRPLSLKVIKSADMMARSRYRKPRSIIPAFLFSLPDRQLQVFQPFHLWHTLAGFSRAAFFRRSHKAASSARALSDSAFFILFTSFPY
jgi:hypothetical protein